MVVGSGAAADDDPKLRAIKIELRALLLSTKGETEMKKLDREYADITGYRIPFQDFGHSSLMNFLKSIPDVVQVNNYGGDVMLRGCSNEKMTHIHKLVLGQSSKKKGRVGRVAPPRPRFARPAFRRGGAVARGGARGWHRPNHARFQLIDARQRVKQQIFAIVDSSPNPINIKQLHLEYQEKHGQMLHIRMTFEANPNAFFYDEMRHLINVETRQDGSVWLSSKRNANTRNYNNRPPPAPRFAKQQAPASSSQQHRPRPLVVGSPRVSVEDGKDKCRSLFSRAMSEVQQMHTAPVVRMQPVLPAPVFAVPYPPPLLVSPQPRMRVVDADPYGVAMGHKPMPTVSQMKTQRPLIPRPAQLCSQVTEMLCDAYPDGIALDDLESVYEKKYGLVLNMSKNFHKSWNEWLTTSMKSLTRMSHDRSRGYVIFLSDEHAKKRNLDQRAPKPEPSPVVAAPVDYKPMSVTVKRDSEERTVTQMNQFDEQRATEDCLDLLARYPDGVLYDNFIQIYEQCTDRKWQEWPGLTDIALPKRQNDQLYILPRGAQAANTSTEEKGELDVDWLYSALLSGPLALSEIKQQCEIAYEQLLELLFVKNQHKFELEWNGREARVHPRRPVDPEPRSSDWVFKEVAPLNVAIATQDIPGMSYEQLNALPDDSDDRFFQVEVSQYYSPTRFFIQYKDLEKQFRSLMTQMKELYAGPESESFSISPHLVKKDVVCAAPYDQFGYHRVQVKELAGNNDVVVSYLDYGTEDRVPISSLRRLLVSFCRLPAQAVQAQIPNVEPIAENWSHDVQTRFLGLCSEPNCTLWAFLLAKQDVLIVELTRVGEHEDLHISQALIDNNLARSSQQSEIDEMDALEKELSEAECLLGFDNDEIQELEDELDGPGETQEEEEEDVIVGQLRNMIADCGLEEAKRAAQFSLKLNENKKNEQLALLNSGERRPLEETSLIVEKVTAIEMQQLQIRTLAFETGMNIDL